MILKLIKTGLAVVSLATSVHAGENAIKSITAERFSTNPLITPESDPSLGDNINGPSVIKVPEWISKPLGKYYMYFGHHHGQFIRLAYADDIKGPWKIYKPGVLPLKDLDGFTNHMASPDVHVDNDKKQIRMYFHARCTLGTYKSRRPPQVTGVATSTDGINFTGKKANMGRFYFRVFEWKNKYYSAAWGSYLSVSDDPLVPFKEMKPLVPFKGKNNRVRHCAVTLRGNKLLLFYSRVGDEPERIMVSTVELDGDAKNWTASEPLEVLKPEKDYEGVKYDLKPSKNGPASGVQELRDPCIFEENDKTYLFYSIAGEEGIAGAELKILMK